MPGPSPILPVPLRPGPLSAWLRRRGAAADFEVADRTPLTGGVASAAVERVALRTSVGRIDVVAKRAQPSEAAVLRLVTAVPATPAFGELIDAGTDDAGAWLVVPFYPGGSLPPEAEPPAEIYRSLARLHSAFFGRLDEVPAGVGRMDEPWCRHALTEFPRAGLRAAQGRDPQPVHERALGRLADWAATAAPLHALHRLPPTLLHGDLYGLNVLGAGAQARLIDWGAARIGPAMFDVALALRWESPALAAYLAAERQARAVARPAAEVELGHVWGRFMTSAMFLGAVAERFGPELAARQLDEAEQAWARLVRLVP